MGEKQYLALRGMQLSGGSQASSLLLPPPRDVNSQLSLKENVLCFGGGLIEVVALK